MRLVFSCNVGDLEISGLLFICVTIVQIVLIMIYGTFIDTRTKIK